MMSRCYSLNDKRYPIYGGRGIEVVPRWHSFVGFWEDMEEGYSDVLTLDRKDTNGNYSKENCRWTTWQEQQRNRRDTLNVEYKGEKLTLRKLCEDKGTDYMTVYQRVKLYGWNLERALSTPSRIKNNKRKKI